MTRRGIDALETLEIVRCWILDKGSNGRLDSRMVLKLLELVYREQAETWAAERKG